MYIFNTFDHFNPCTPLHESEVGVAPILQGLFKKTIVSLRITNINGSINTNVKNLYKISSAWLVLNRFFTYVFMFPFMFVIRKLTTSNCTTWKWKQLSVPNVTHTFVLDNLLMQLFISLLNKKWNQINLIQKLNRLFICKSEFKTGHVKTWTIWALDILTMFTTQTKLTITLGLGQFVDFTPPY